MSQISLKSISGITSITSPAGVDNQLTIHTNDTTERLKVTTSGINVTGVVTATSFQGDGSALTGIAADKIFEGNTEAEVVDTGSNGHFKVTTEGTEKFRIKSNGYVGIGTENPQRSLAVTSGTSGVTAEFNVPDNAPTGSAGLSLNIVNRSNSGYAPLSFNATLYTFGNSGTERLRIDSDGRLLVGSTSTNQNISKIVVKASSPSDAYDNHLYLEGNETSGAADTGGVLGFGGHDGGSSFRNWANILGMKENASSGNTASYMAFHTRANGGNPTERLRISSGGKLLIGHNAAQSVGGGNSLLQIQATNSTGRISVVQHRNEAGGSPFISLGKSRGTSNGSTTILQSGDEIGTLTWAGADGNDLDNQACCITGVVDGTPGSNDMPGRLEFRTTADGSASATTRMKISKEGYVTKPNHPAFHARLQSNTTSTANPLVYGDVRVNNGSHYKSSGSDAGKFVVPVAGIYFFYFVAVKYNNGSVCRLYPYVNGSKIYNQMHLRLQETGTYSNGSLQFCYTCSAGDKVHISLEAGQVLGAEYTHFGGFLLG